MITPTASISSRMVTKMKATAAPRRGAAANGAPMTSAGGLSIMIFVCVAGEWADGERRLTHAPAQMAIQRSRTGFRE
jgi:hypothetical protein